MFFNSTQPADKLVFAGLGLVAHFAVDDQDGRIERIIVGAEHLRVMLSGIAHRHDFQRHGDLSSPVEADHAGCGIVGAPAFREKADRRKTDKRIAIHRQELAFPPE